MRQPLIFACYVVATLCLAVLVLVGYALKGLYGEHMPEESEAWNCWAFAVPKWLVDPVRTGLLITKSAHGPVPHTRYVPSLVNIYYEEAIPLAPRKGWRSVIDSFKFKAKINKHQPLSRV